jgi:hypothetical protein
MKMKSVTIMMNALMIPAVLSKDVFTLIIPTNVFLQTNVTKLTAIRAKDVLSLIPLTVVMMMTNVTNGDVMKN